MRPRIILEGAGSKPELPRCILCNQPKYVFSDSRLCDLCDATQRMEEIPFPNMDQHNEEVCDALASDVEGYKSMIRSLRNCLATEKKARRKEVRSLQKAILKHKKINVCSK